MSTMWNGDNVCPTLTKNNAGGGQRMPDKENFNAVIECVAIDQGTEKSSCSVYKELAPTLATTPDPSKNQGGTCICYENHAQDSRVKELSQGVAPQLNAKAGTGGNNLPLAGNNDQSVYWNGGDVSDSLKCNSDHDQTPYQRKMSCVIQGGVDCLTPSSDHPQTHRVYGTDGAFPALMSNGGKAGQDQSGVLVDADGCDTFNYDLADGISHTLCANSAQTATREGGGRCYAIAKNVIGRKIENGGNGVGAQSELAYTQNATGVMGVGFSGTVRRLLPVECERLMGFPDGHTQIPWKGKPAEECPDSPRYKACGNSMCVNVMRWIGERIEMVERKHRGEE